MRASPACTLPDLAPGANKHQHRQACRHPQRLMFCQVIVVIIEHRVAPSRRPVMTLEPLFASSRDFLAMVRFLGAVEQDGQALVVGHPAILVEEKLTRIY